ncbi:MAG TPA: thiol reductant ABC exporter subunit CydD [Actinomycetota bacterium]
MTDRRDQGRPLRAFDRRLLKRAVATRWTLLVNVAAGLAGTLLLLAQMTLLAAVIADAAQGRLGHVPVALLATVAGIVAARAGLVQVVELSGRRAATRLLSALRAELVEHRLRPGAGGPGRSGGAELAAGAVQGVDGLETYFARYLPQTVLAVVVPLAVLCWCAAVDLTSALIMAVTLPVMPVFMALIGRSAGARARANVQALVGLSGWFLDVTRGLPTLRAFNRGAVQVARIREVTERYRRTTMGTLRLSFLSGVVLDLAATLSTALVAVTLGVRLAGGDLGLRPALTVLMLVPELYVPLRAVAVLYHASADGLAGVQRILDALDGGPAGRRKPAPLPAATPPSRGLPVGLRQVTVRYPDRPLPALQQVDLDLHPGELVAVVGTSGAGKTTLGRVLLGLTRPGEGALVVGGRPLTGADLEWWRHRVAWASQHPALIPGTVATNLALGRPGAGMTAVEEAARLAGAHPFVQRLPDGYATTVGSGGHGLSAGQRQRLGLARALLRDADLLVLDEPTVHLDAAAAVRVAATIAALRGTRTVLLLTHDPDLAAAADRVLRLEAGRFVPAALGVGVR